nr:T9SS type A sorting domain-containing protein [Bacteroidota bacterium]
MKNITILILFVFSFHFSSYSQYEWTVIHPNPTPKDLIDAFFVSDKKGWVVGTDGLIMFTGDSGESWEIQHSNANEAMWGVFFADDMEGWTVGWSKIYHTSDAGNTWEYQSHPALMGDLMDVFFLNQDTGWVVGTYKNMLKTTDGGESWTRITIQSDDWISFNKIFFTDELHGCVVGGDLMYPNDGLVMISEDGGESWIEIPTPGQKCFNGVYFISQDIGWICGYEGGIMKTSDGGATWDDYGISVNKLVDIYFYDEMFGIALDNNEAFLTQNGGETWKADGLIGATSSQRAFCPIGDSSGVSVGFYGSICKTRDRGHTWENLNSGYFNTINQLGFFTALDGLAIGGDYYNSELIRTDDGGYNWYEDTLVENGPFYLLRILDQNCYLLNISSQMMKTNNCGASWELLDVPDTLSYYSDLQFPNENIGFLCGPDGIFFKTIDGGATWSDKSLDDSFDFCAVYFLNENIGWLIDILGNRICRTLNGGDAWTFIAPGGNPNSIFFLNDDIGYVSTWGGYLFRTVDGGDTWDEFYSFPQGVFSKVFFIDQLEGWFMASHSLYHTVDGGLSWVYEQYFEKNLLSVFFLDDHYAWLSGMSGLVATYNPIVTIDEHKTKYSSIQISPNPAIDNITIEIDNETDHIKEVMIYNIHGQRIRHLPGLHETGPFTLNLKGFVAGLYLLYVKTEKMEKTSRIVLR